MYNRECPLDTATPQRGRRNAAGARSSTEGGQANKIARDNGKRTTNGQGRLMRYGTSDSDACVGPGKGLTFSGLFSGRIFAISLSEKWLFEARNRRPLSGKVAFSGEISRFFFASWYYLISLSGYCVN
jgi:hypothetical protein